MVRTFQARLDAKHGLIKRKVLDNNIELEGVPEDCIFIKYDTNREGDKLNWNIEKAEVCSIVFPPLQDIPMDKIECSSEDSTYKISSLYNIAAEGEAAEKFKIIFTHKANISKDDLIVRVFVDPDVKEPVIMIMRVTQVLGTFGHLMLETQAANCTLVLESLPDGVPETISAMALRRLHIGF